MKKLLLLTLALFLLLPSAGGVEVDGIYYLLVGTRYAVVASRGGAGFEPDSYAGDVVVPAEFSYRGNTYEVVSVGPSAFAGCEKLTSVRLPSTVRSLSGSAFLGSDALCRVEVPADLLAISACAFTGCQSLQEVVFPRGAERVDTLTLYCCTSLTSVTLPHRIHTICQGALKHLSSLRQLYCYASQPPTCEQEAFFVADQQQCTLHVPAYTLQSYREAEGWRDFGRIVPITDAEYEAQGYVRGDVNVDGRVDADDLLLLGRIVVSLPDGSSVHWAADINADGKVNAVDYVLLARQLAQ